MNYAIDTDVAIDYLKGKKKAIERLQELETPAIHAPVAAQLYYGAHNSANPEKNPCILGESS
jgi:predicted nucleic acid-binding protein